MTGRRSNAEINTLFKQWVIPHSRADSAMEMMESMREQKRLSSWDLEAPAAYLTAPSQSGKSHTVSIAYFEKYVVPQFRAENCLGPEFSNSELKRLQKKVLYVKIPAKPSLGAFAAALLEAMHDTKPWNGGPYERLNRAYTQMKELGVELLILDNFDHLAKVHTRTLQEEATRLQDTIKEMIEKGWPVVFVGLPSANTTILNQLQIAHRVEEIYFGPFRTPEEEFVEYVGCLDILMVEHGIFDKESDLADPAIYRRLLISSVGQLGILSNTVRQAAKLASAQRLPRITVDHLKIAVRTYPMRLKLCAYNPFDIDDDEDLKPGLARHYEEIVAREAEEERLMYA